MRRSLWLIVLLMLISSVPSARAEVGEVIITRGDGVGFLPLMVMEKLQLVEKKGNEAGIKVAAKWVNISGSGAVNDALLSGSAQFISGGIPGMLTLWDRTKGKLDVIGVGSINSQPMYLNTSASHLKTIDDLTAKDKVAVTAIKISIPAIVMQMYAREKYGEASTFRFDPFTVAMKHPDGVVALLSGSAGVTAHYTSPPFHQRERKDPRIRTIQTTNDVLGGPASFAIMVAAKKFREENPKVFKAVFEALRDSHAYINSNKQQAAEILHAAMGGRGWQVSELLEVLNDPDIKFDVTPRNVMRYAKFMADVGSIKNRLAKWSDLFAPETEGLPGN
ncbi:MAG: ABC transporter substrate-binding protein [Hyphomicrobiaceae bacterium]